VRCIGIGFNTSLLAASQEAVSQQGRTLLVANVMDSMIVEIGADAAAVTTFLKADDRRFRRKAFDLNF